MKKLFDYIFPDLETFKKHAPVYCFLLVIVFIAIADLNKDSQTALTGAVLYFVLQLWIKQL